MDNDIIENDNLVRLPINLLNGIKQELFYPNSDFCFLKNKYKYGINLGIFYCFNYARFYFYTVFYIKETDSFVKIPGLYKQYLSKYLYKILLDINKIDCVSDNKEEIINRLEKFGIYDISIIDKLIYKRDKVMQIIDDLKFIRNNVEDLENRKEILNNIKRLNSELDTAIGMLGGIKRIREKKNSN